MLNQKASFPFNQYFRSLIGKVLNEDENLGHPEPYVPLFYPTATTELTTVVNAHAQKSNIAHHYFPAEQANAATTLPPLLPYSHGAHAHTEYEI